jgi:hypothetical protein
MYTCPVLFVVAGFLQSYSFLQTNEREMFSVSNLGKFYLWRYCKFAVIQIVMMMFAFFLVQPLGSGPVWPVYATVMEPCHQYWWTVLLQVNNLYPAGYDNKCMAWAWFIPALT